MALERLQQQISARPVGLSPNYTGAIQQAAAAESRMWQEIGYIGANVAEVAFQITADDTIASAEDQAAIDIANGAIRRDENGKLVAPDQRSTMTLYGRVWNEAIRQGYASRAEADIVEMAGQLRNQHLNDPGGFEESWGAWQRGYVEAIDPWLKGAVAEASSRYGTQVQLGILDRQAQMQLQEAQELNTLAVARRVSDLEYTAQQYGADDARVAQGKANLLAMVDGWIEKGIMTEADRQKIEDGIDLSIATGVFWGMVDQTATPPMAATQATASEELINRVIGAESNGRAGAIGPMTASGDRAQGLMQVMPGTGPEAAAIADVEWRPDLMTDTSEKGRQYQQLLGVAYLNAQLRDFGGSVPLALAAYNAGPQRVRDWIASGKVVDPRVGGVEAFMASIPFKETRAYVQKIMGSSEGFTAESLVDITGSMRSIVANPTGVFAGMPRTELIQAMSGAESFLRQGFNLAQMGKAAMDELGRERINGLVAQQQLNAMRGKPVMTFKDWGPILEQYPQHAGDIVTGINRVASQVQGVQADRNAGFLDYVQTQIATGSLPVGRDAFKQVIELGMSRGVSKGAIAQALTAAAAENRRRKVSQLQGQEIARSEATRRGQEWSAEKQGAMARGELVPSEGMIAKMQTIGEAAGIPQIYINQVIEPMRAAVARSVPSSSEMTARQTITDRIAAAATRPQSQSMTAEEKRVFSGYAQDLVALQNAHADAREREMAVNPDAAPVERFSANPNEPGFVGLIDQVAPIGMLPEAKTFLDNVANARGQGQAQLDPGVYERAMAVFDIYKKENFGALNQLDNSTVAFFDALTAQATAGYPPEVGVPRVLATMREIGPMADPDTMLSRRWGTGWQGEQSLNEFIAEGFGGSLDGVPQALQEEVKWLMATNPVMNQSPEMARDLAIERVRENWSETSTRGIPEALRNRHWLLWFQSTSGQQWRYRPPEWYLSRAGLPDTGAAIADIWDNVRSRSPVGSDMTVDELDLEYVPELSTAARPIYQARRVRSEGGVEFYDPILTTDNEWLHVDLAAEVARVKTAERTTQSQIAQETLLTGQPDYGRDLPWMQPSSEVPSMEELERLNIERGMDWNVARPIVERLSDWAKAQYARRLQRTPPIADQMLESDFGVSP